MKTKKWITVLRGAVIGLMLQFALFPLSGEAAVNIRLQAPRKVINVGEYIIMKATVAGSSGNPVTWKSLNAAVATVNGSGLVIGRKAGDATIMASCQGASARYTVTVRPVVRLSASSVTMNDGDKKTLRATVFGKKQTVTWKSLNADVAIVNRYGVVTARKPGKAAIIATDSGVSARCLVTVNAVIELSSTSLQLKAGETAWLEAKQNGKLTAVTWKSLNSPVATIDAYGEIKAHKAGRATILASASGHTARCTVTVTTSKNKRGKALDAYRSYLENRELPWYPQTIRFELLQVPQFDIPLLCVEKAFKDYIEFMPIENYSCRILIYEPGANYDGQKDIALYESNAVEFLNRYGFIWEEWDLHTSKDTVSRYMRWNRGGEQKCYKMESETLPIDPETVLTVISTQEFQRAIGSAKKYDSKENVSPNVYPYVVVSRNNTWHRDYLVDGDDPKSIPQFPMLQNNSLNRFMYLK